MDNVNRATDIPMNLTTIMLKRPLQFNLLWLFFPLLLSARQEHLTEDTVTVSLVQADQIFLRNNLQLLAAKFNIEAAKAAILQAQLWNNPNISIEQNIYNQETGRYFDFTSSGNTEVQLQQLFLLAGKRGKQIRMAEINSQIAEQTFYDLLRSLKTELHTDLYDLHFLEQSLRFYDESIVSVKKTVMAMEVVYEKRSVLLSELLRLKSLLFTLENERLGLVNRKNEIQSRLRVLLDMKSRVHFQAQIDRTKLDTLSLDTVPLNTVMEAAMTNRPDLKLAESTLALEETNLALQKALGMPDVTVGGRWSRAGSYIPEYFALSVSVDLPIFNRNQGNIAVSERTIEADRALRNNVRQNVEKEIAVAYDKAKQTDKLYRSLDKKFVGEYTTLAEGMIANYEKRNMSIIEFTDFYESFRTSMLQLNQLQSDRIDAFENINFVAGTSLLNL
jgi:cobalt-zinc-cadmium efflux system outer membrane protein